MAIPIKEPVSKKTMVIKKANYERAVQLLALPDYARSSDNPVIRKQAEELNATFQERTELGHVQFEGMVSISLWLCADGSRNYYLSWAAYHPSKKSEQNEVLMFLPEETIIFNRHRYQVHLEIV